MRSLDVADHSMSAGPVDVDFGEQEVLVVKLERQKWCLSKDSMPLSGKLGPS